MLFIRRHRRLLTAFGISCALLILLLLRVHSDTSQVRPQEKPEGGYRIVRTAEGFSPETLIIPQGEAVTFVDETGTSFWPASNGHPAHTIYPQFDPKRPLGAEEEWTFAFSEPGRWRFHDHLYPNATGLVVVVPENGLVPREPTTLHDCEGVSTVLKQGCWDNLLSFTLRAQGLAAAFSLFADLYATEPDVPKNCHGWGHALGQEAYNLYVAGERFDVPREASYCGYGFYHGFLERLVSETGSAHEAYAFCQTVREDNPGKTLVYDNCIHGIGHGSAASIIENPLMYGKYQSAINRGAAFCRSFTSDPQELRDCFDGVFNELVLDVWNGEYGLSRERDLNTADPLDRCREQSVDLQASCYFEYMGFFEHLFEGDFAAAASYLVQAIPLQEHQEIAIRKLAGDFMQSLIVQDTYAPQVAVCLDLSGTLRSECFNGLSVGLIAHGEPQHEYEKALAFCGSGLLPSGEDRACFERMLYAFNEIYEPDLFAHVCTLTPEEYRSTSCVQ